MKTRTAVIAAAIVVTCTTGAAAEVRLTVDASRVTGRIDERIYSHFLEHIYHSCNGGLWGDLVWNRSFEEAAMHWSASDGIVEQASTDADRRLTFGDPKWTDYEFTLEARKADGAEGFLVLFRVSGKDEFYWMNLGGWGNTHHGVERGVKGEKRHKGLKGCGEGSIETGRWYRLRARCEGRHFQFWLDDRQILDFTDDDARAHLAGMVGIGTWQTHAQFRNLRVTTLDGKKLFEGLPPNLQPAVPARHWQSFGSGKVVAERSQPFNGKVCMHLVATDGAAGLRQTNFCLRAGETYCGSLWACGHGDVVVNLGDAEQKLPPLTAEWKEYPLSFAPKSGDAMQIIARAGADVCVDQVSLMPNSWRVGGGLRPDLLKAVAELRPPVIRWPGGSFTAYYRWKDGIGPQSKRGSYPRAMWDDLDSNNFGTDEFIQLCRKVGAEPLIVINVGHRDRTATRADYIQEALDWLEYCNGPATSKWGKVRAVNGHPEPYRVKYWEIDNETWGMGATNYAAAVRDFVPAMKKMDLSIKIIACGNQGYSHGQFGIEWNNALLADCGELIDYLSPHHYENPARFAEGPTNYEKFLRETARDVAASKNPNVKLFVSEWNAQSTDWRTGLYCGGILNAFERNSDLVAMATPALFLRHVTAPEWDNAFINFDSCGWFPAPNYVVMKLWRDHFAPNLLALAGDPGPLNITATKGDRLVLKAVNPSSNAVPVELNVKPGFTIGAAEFMLVNPGGLEARNSLAEPNQVHPVPAAVEIAGQTVRFIMPPLSAGVIALEERSK